MNKKKVIYIGILLIITVMVSITAFSYAYLTRTDEQHGKLNMTVGTLDYKIESDDLNNNSITLSANESKEIELTIRSLNQIDSKYKLYTNSVENVTIGYLDETGFDESTGTINANGTVKVKIVLDNGSDTSKTITFGVQGGFDYNDVTLKSGRVEIEEGQALCTPGIAYEFDYTGSDQELTVKCSGLYKLEVWGAQGGSSTGRNNSSFAGGKGGYSVGNIEVNNNDLMYVNVGGTGTHVTTEGCFNGGYNGGGTACASQYYVGIDSLPGTGGGATDIRINDNSNYARVIVAGGGAGGHTYSPTNYNSNTGVGGGLIGQDGSKDRESVQEAKGGTQVLGGTGGRFDSSYAYAGSGSFGQGGSGLSAAHDNYYLGSGGGGGWYGGGGGGHFSGAGGSGWIYTESSYNNWSTNSTEGQSGNWLLNSDYYLSKASTLSGNQTITEPDGTIATGHTGNGYARITYLGKKYIVTFNANDGTVGENTRDVFENNNIGTLPIPTRNNYVFKGWYLENTFNTLVDENYVVSGDITLYAKWDAILVVDRNIINQGTFRNVTPTYLTNQVDGTDGFTIVGRPSQNTNARCNNVPYYQWNTWLRWDYSIDLTNYSTIKLYCKKNADHGACSVYITDGINKAPGCDSSTTVYASTGKGYPELAAGGWQEFELDVSEITGTHVLSLIGGYNDASGNPSSSTSYSNIRFIP